MTEHLKEAAYPGQIDIGGDRSPVTYKLKASKEDDGGYHVAISLMAPRDWLLKHGFENQATLVRDGSDDILVRSDEKLDVADNISVILRGEDAMLASMDELSRKFPELRA